MDQIRAPASATLSAGGEDDRRGMLRDGIAQPGHRIVERLLSLIARRGGNAGNILRANGFDQPLDQFLVDTLPSLDMTTLQRLSSQASVAVSDLQARASGRLPFRGGDWRLLFYCLVGSRTLREAIVRMEELLTAIDGRMGSVSLKRSAGRASLIYTGARSGDEEMDFIVTLHGQLMFHAIFSWLIGKSLDGAVALDFPESARCYLDDELLPFDLALGAGQPEMTFAGTLLDQPVIRTMSDCEALTAGGPGPVGNRPPVPALSCADAARTAKIAFAGRIVATSGHRPHDIAAQAAQGRHIVPADPRRTAPRIGHRHADHQFHVDRGHCRAARPV